MRASQQQKQVFQGFQVFSTVARDMQVPYLGSTIHSCETASSFIPLKFCDNPLIYIKRVNEHLLRDKNSHVFKHLNCSKHCRETIVMPPVLKLLILLRLSHNLKSRRVFILNG